MKGRLKIFYKNENHVLVTESILRKDLKKYVEQYGEIVIDYEGLYILVDKQNINEGKYPAFLTVDSAFNYPLFALPFLYKYESELRFFTKKGRRK